MPAQISIRPLAKNGFKGAIIGLVVTDMTEARRSEEMLRALTHRVVQVQEAERGRVALELHDNITQNLCAVLPRWQALANKLPAHEKASRGEVMKLSEMLGQTVEEVQRIARNLRSSVLDELGLVPALRATCTEFADRTGVSLKLACKPLTARLPAEGELALYRILQNALENVEKHARARHVTVCLRQRTFGSASTRSITRPDEKEWAALVCSACASERPMWAASSRSNPFAAPARKSRCSFPCRQVPRRLTELTYETNRFSPGAARSRLGRHPRSNSFNKLRSDQSHSHD
jgi:hypothetical protein